MTPIVSVVGRSGSGKTTLLEKLLRELTRRGRRIGTVKHHVHGPVSVDMPGKDSWRHKQAGARAVALVSDEACFVVQEISDRLSLDTIVHRYLVGMDLVLTEGFHAGAAPKIEVSRAALGTPLLCSPEDDLVAVVSDRETGAPVPHFGLDAAPALADFLEAHFLRSTPADVLELLIGGRRVPLEADTAEVLRRVVWSLVGDARTPVPTGTVELRIPGHAP